MTFLRDGDAINFQRASCTLDGCVRIYSSRIDSAVDETGKLLNGLSSGGKLPKEDEAPAAEGETQQPEKQRKKRSGRSTLEPMERAAETLCLRRQDLEATVDPLFRKMCADFDEGNVTSGRGHLLSQLAVDPIEYRLLFEADTPLPPVMEVDAEVPQLNVEDIRQHFAADLAFLLTEPPICPSLATQTSVSTAVPAWINQAVAKAQEVREEEVDSDDDDDYFPDEAPFLPEPTHPLPGAVSFEGADQFVDFGGMDDFPAADGDWAEEEAEGLAPMDTHSMMIEEPVLKGSAWAGPEHWRVRVARRPTTTAAVPKERKKRQELDFYQTDVDLASLFAKPASALSISLSRAMIEERQTQDHSLPPDLHYGSQDLLRLFTKPKVMGMRTKRVPKPVDGPIDWTAEAQEVQATVSPQELVDTGFAGDDFGGDVGFDDFGGDVDFGGGFDEVLPTAAAIDFTSTAPNENLPAVPVSSLPYARVAKRVDIQRLKSTLWSEYTAPKPKKTLSQLMQQLPATDFPADQLKDVSIAYCFICLLHLANEHSLELIPTDNGDLIIQK